MRRGWEATWQSEALILGRLRHQSPGALLAWQKSCCSSENRCNSAYARYVLCCINKINMQRGNCALSIRNESTYFLQDKKGKVDDKRYSKPANECSHGRSRFDLRRSAVAQKLTYKSPAVTGFMAQRPYRLPSYALTDKRSGFMKSRSSKP